MKMRVGGFSTSRSRPQLCVWLAFRRHMERRDESMTYLTHDHPPRRVYFALGNGYDVSDPATLPSTPQLYK